MKRVILRLATLLVMVAAGVVFYYDSPVQAAACWEQVYARWQTCDNNYSNTFTAHYFAPQTCASTAQNSCQQHPQGSSAYNSCYATYNSSCITQDQQNYNNRGSAYGSCIGIEGNIGNCVEQLQFTCDDARFRAATCDNLYGYGNGENADGEAYSACINNSGIGQCQ